MAGPPHPRQSLHAYVDDRLRPWQRALLERHLGRCTRCALEVARIQQLRRRLAAPPPHGPSPELLDRLLDIGRAPGGRPDGTTAPGDGRRAPAAQPVLVAAAGLLVAGLLVLGAAGAGAVATGALTPGAGPGPRASLTTVLPRLWSWPSQPDDAATERPVDNGDRP